MNEKYEEIIARARENKGRFVALEYVKECKTKKNAPSITKVTKASAVRIGCEYDALKTTLENKGVDNKEDAHKLNNGLNGMSWVEYPVLLASNKTGKQYIRIETCKNTKFTSKYYMDGKEVAKNDIAEFLLASEKSSRGEMPSVLNIGVQGITEIR